MAFWQGSADDRLGARRPDPDGFDADAILEAFDAEGGRVLSPKELSRELDEPLPTVAHHVRRLAAMELLELARTRPSGGSIEHFYRLVARRWGGEDRGVRRSEGESGLVLARPGES